MNLGWGSWGELEFFSSGSNLGMGRSYCMPQCPGQRIFQLSPKGEDMGATVLGSASNDMSGGVMRASEGVG